MEIGNSVNKKKKIHIIIIDDHEIVREGLKQIFADTDDIVVVGEGQTGLDAIRLAREIKSDLMLLDITMPEETKSGLVALEQIHREFPKLAVLIFSMHREEQYALRALKAGAVGYVNKQGATDELISAIRLVAQGKRYISPNLAQLLAERVDNPDKLPHETLSTREYQTFEMLASGKSIGEIADQLALSKKTISEFRARLLAKMKLKNNAEIMRYAILHKLIKLEE